MAGSQDFAVDPRNADLKVYVNGELVPRAEAKVSVFDAGFVLGDPAFQIIGMPDIVRPATAVEHVSPERHRPGLSEGLSFDKLRTDGCCAKARPPA